MEHVHPFHKHPLLLIGDQENHFSDKEEYSTCSGCSAPIISGSIFICSEQGCKFVLHKSCYESPMEITHFLHTDHPLALHGESPYESGNAFCDHCKESIKGFMYHCSSCKYDLDVMCASLRSSYILQEEDHRHKFVMIKPIPFTCDICGKASKGASLLCITCQTHVHPACSSPPRIVKLYTHNCPLKLTFGHQLEKSIDTINQFCRACLKTVDTRYGFYYCVECEYIADIRCATDEDYRDYQFDLETNTSSSLRYKDIGKIDLQTWHKHGLVLCEDEITTDDQEVVCRGCVSIISKSAPFYECKEKCGYSLCESCANLYEKFRHPLFHPEHDLVLSDKGNFFCRLCRLPSSGFRYLCTEENCESSKFDIKCALRSYVIHIEMAHEHPLRIIVEGEFYDKKCRGCSSGCARARYSCSDCDYNLCYRCVGLPTSAKHGWDEHPLVLTYESVPHEYGEYYCDQCEEPRDPNHWFYYCAICDRDVHPKCMGLHNLDLTRKCRMRVHPRHTLILKANPQVYPTCGNCGFACKDLYFKCLDCKYCLHYMKCEPSGRNHQR